MRHRKISGFTLIELMIALAVAAILGAAAVTSYQGSALKAKRAEAKSALMQLMQQEERFNTQNNTYIVFSKASTNPNELKFKWFSGDSATKSYYETKGVACTGDTIQNCVLLTATPGTSNVISTYTDPVCGSYTLSSTGVKGITGSGTVSQCW